MLTPALARSPQLIAMMVLLALLILAMLQPENASTSSRLLLLNVLSHAKLMLNAESMLLTTSSTQTAKSLFVTRLSVLVLLRTMTRPTVKNAIKIVNQIPTVIPLHAFGLEPNINANTLQRTATMERLAPLTPAMQRLVNANTSSISALAALHNVTLTLIALPGVLQTNFLPNACSLFVTKTKELANLFQIPAALLLALKHLIALLPNSVPFAFLALVFLTNVNSMLIVWLLTPALAFGTIANLAQLELTVVFLFQYVPMIPIVTITILAPATFACLNMDSAETFHNVMTTTHVPKIFALLLLMQNHIPAPILLFLAQPILPSSARTSSCFPTKTKLNGLENVTRTQVASLVLSMLNAMITMDVPLIHANNNIALAFQLTTLGAILSLLPNQFTTNLFLVW
jgi:hypothetical protein